MSLGSLAWFAITLYFHTPFMVLTLFRLCYSVCQCPQKKRIPVATKLEARKNTLIYLFRKLVQSKSVLNFKVADSSEVLNDKTQTFLRSYSPYFDDVVSSSLRLYRGCQTENVRNNNQSLSSIDYERGRRDAIFQNATPIMLRRKSLVTSIR